MTWLVAKGSEPEAVALADRHYSRILRGKPGAPVQVNGRRIVLLSADADALWMSQWSAFRRDDFGGAWLCTIFRNEGPRLSSELVREAVAITRSMWGDPPDKGFVTWVDKDATRRKRDPGRCFRKAGFVFVGLTQEFGRVILQLAPPSFPPPASRPPLWMPAAQGALL